MKDRRLAGWEKTRSLGLQVGQTPSLVTSASLTVLSAFIGQLATIGHYSFSRCGELLNVLLGHFPLLPLHHSLKGKPARR